MTLRMSINSHRQRNSSAPTSPENSYSNSPKNITSSWHAPIIKYIIIIIVEQTIVLNLPMNEERHIGARSARRESVNSKQASFQ